MEKPGISSDGKKETKKSSDPTCPTRQRGKESELKSNTPIIEIHPSTPKQASKEECDSPETAEPSTSKKPGYGLGFSACAMELEAQKQALSPVSPQQTEEGSMSSKLSLSPPTQRMEESTSSQLSISSSSKLSISPQKQMEEESTSQKSISPPSPTFPPSPTLPKKMESTSPKQSPSQTTPKRSLPSSTTLVEEEPTTPRKLKKVETLQHLESAPATPKQRESVPATPKQMESDPATPKQMEQESEILFRKEAPSTSKKSSFLSSSPEGTSASRTESLKASTSAHSPSAEGTSTLIKEFFRASTSAYSPSTEGTSTLIKVLLKATTAAYSSSTEGTSTLIKELLESPTSKGSEKNPTLTGKSRTKEEEDALSTPPSRSDKSWEAEMEMSPGSPFNKVSSYLSKISSKSKERTDSSSETSVETLLTLEAIPEEEEITQKKTPEVRDEEWWKKKVTIFWDIIEIIYRINKKRNHVQKLEDPCCRIYSDLDYKTINPCSEILDAVNEMKFLHPSFIQKAGLKCFVGRNRDILVQSPRWSGKTTLMIMACLGKVNFSKKHPQAIMLNPLKEEAMKTLSMANDLAQYFRRAAFFLAVGDQSDENPDDKHIVIGTPSEVLDLASRKELIDVTKIKVIAFDDLHNMPPSEYNAALNLSSLVSEFCSRMTLSIPAFTMDLGILEKGRKFVKSSLELEICGLQDVVHLRFLCHHNHEKATFISKTFKLFTNRWKFAVFCNDPIAWFQRIPVLFQKACVLPKNVTEEDIERKLNVFRDNPNIMCVLAQSSRFLPVVGYWIRTVLNVDLPIDANGDLDVEEYFNRTGRIERIGMVVNLSEQKYDEKLRVISNYTKKEILAL